LEDADIFDDFDPSNYITFPK